MRSTLKSDKSEFIAGMVVGGAVIGMVFSFIFTLADVASKPAVHTASYAVLHSSPPYSLPVTPDQERATLVSLSWLAPGHLLTEVTQ